MPYEISALPPLAAREVWPTVEPWIAKALTRTKIDQLYLPQDILFGIAQQEYHLWVAHEGPRIDACLVTRVNVYPRLKTCAVFIVAGKNMKAWLALAETRIEAYAKSVGCKWMEGGGRVGWIRAAGYEQKGVVVVKEL